MASTTITRLSLPQRRRAAVHAQLLDGSARDVLDVVRRIGSLWGDRLLFEWRAFIYPIEDLPLYRSRMRRFPIGDYARPRLIREWLNVNDSFRQYVLGELERRGPLLSRDLEDRAHVPWRSAGWTANRNVSQMLEFLTARGEVAIAGRRGAQRLWGDRAERLFGFRYRMEIYVPQARRWGYFVMPVLQGDRLVGRVDPAFDRRSRVLTVNRVGWEEKPVDIRRALRSLADFLGAEEVVWR